MNETDACPSCGASLEIRPVGADCPECVGRFERWFARVSRIVGERGGAGQGNALGDGEHGPVLLQAGQQWFNDGLTPERAAERALALLADLARTPGTG